MTALCTLGGAPVLDLQLHLPRVGVWHADVSVDSQDELTGQQTLDVDGNEFKGTVRRGGVSSHVGVYRVVGGAGGLLKLATAKAYNNTTARIVLKDLLDGAGEQLSDTVESGLLSTQLQAWVTVQRQTGPALLELLAALGADFTMRVLPDGTVWLGKESWPVESPKTLSFSGIDTRLGRFTVGLSEGSMVLPGTCYEKDETKVSYVRVSSRDGSDLEAEVWTE